MFSCCENTVNAYLPKFCIHLITTPKFWFKKVFGVGHTRRTDYIMTSTDNNSQRLTPYRAVIPFYILYDLDLNANHLRLYGQIEQMESNPNPAVQPSFSYAWLAKQLGINRRNTILCANLLREKGYIEHIEISQGKWVWRIARKPVIHEDYREKEHPVSSGISVKLEQVVLPSNTPPSVAGQHPPSVAQRHLKIPELKIPKEDLKTPPTPQGEGLLFEEFWFLYPVKVSKKSCEQKWRRLNLDDIGSEIISKLKEQITSDEVWKSGYAPNPLTYINQERWNDEIRTNKTKNIAKPKPMYDDNDTSWIKNIDRDTL